MTSTLTFRVRARTSARRRDYTGFGPFTFGRAGYEAAVEAAVASLEG